MKIRYVGPHKQIDYPISAARGEVVDVPAELGRELVKQGAWTKVATKKKKKE